MLARGHASATPTSAPTPPRPTRLEVIASETDPGRDEVFSEEDYRELAAVLERYYSLA